MIERKTRDVLLQISSSRYATHLKGELAVAAVAFPHWRKLKEIAAKNELNATKRLVTFAYSSATNVIVLSHYYASFSITKVSLGISFEVVVFKPCYFFELLEQKAIDHGHFVDDEMTTLAPVLAHLRTRREFDALIDVTTTSADSYKKIIKTKQLTLHKC